MAVDEPPFPAPASSSADAAAPAGKADGDREVGEAAMASSSGPAPARPFAGRLAAFFYEEDPLRINPDVADLVARGFLQAGSDTLRVRYRSESFSLPRDCVELRRDGAIFVRNMDDLGMRSILPTGLANRIKDQHLDRLGITKMNFWRHLEGRRADQTDAPWQVLQKMRAAARRTSTSTSPPSKAPRTAT
mmetsp:Transcript_33289/g.99357  ORF Transcript_33289/g.99357 Transcript_33289/m.99357 type:complete len:190 (+) Transcript_33289:86-655(+)